MRLCVGTAKGIVILDPDRSGSPLMVLADPSSVWCMAQDCRDPNVIYAGATNNMGMGAARGKGALSRSIDGGRSWADITNALPREEDVWALAASPQHPDELWVGTSHARLFRSLDRGRTFRELTAFAQIPGRERWTFPPPPHIPHVRSISFDPSDPRTMYVGVEEGGVFRTRNHGASFEALNRGLYWDVHCVAVDPHDSRLLYATTGNGFYRSQDAGASWEHITDGISRGYTVPLLVDAASGTIHVAAAAGPPPTWFAGHLGADTRLFRSTDHGQSFVQVHTEPGPMRAMVMRLVRMPDRSGDFVGVETDGTVIRTRDSGETFSMLARQLPPAYDAVAIP
jgi:photosystem II stability/assembly factor-like uncharacterized protein